MNSTDVSNYSPDALLHLTGDLDVATASDLRRQLFDAIDRGGPIVAVDASAVSFIDSSALGVLVQARTRATKSAQQLILTSPSKRVTTLLDLTGLSSFFTLDVAGD